MSGEGRLVLVSGEAGIGKSALVEDLKKAASQQDFCVLWGGCYDLTTTPPYGPWLEALGRYCPVEDGPQLPPWAVDSSNIEQLGGRSDLFRAFHQFVADLASKCPLVIVLEDMHWSDQGSLDVLRFLARQADGIGVLMIATYRDDELNRGHPLFQALPYLARESDALRLELGPLAPAEIRQLATPFELSPEDTDRLADYLHQRAEGNPLFTLELLRALEAAQALRCAGGQFELGVLEGVHVPALVSQLIERRLAMVPAETRELIEIAAIIGDEIDVGLWARVAGCDEAALDGPIRDAIAATILKESPGGRGLQFTHALVREALYEGVVLSRRRALHRQIAELLVGSTVRDPDAIAHHFERADDARALGWLVAGGVRAKAAIDFLTAADRFERAAAIMAGDPAQIRERGWLIQLAGELTRYSGGERSARLHEEAYRTGSACGDTLLEATALGRRGSQHNLAGELGIGMRKIESAAAMVDRLTTAGEDDDANQALRSVVCSLLPADAVGASRVSALGTADSRHSGPGELMASRIALSWGWLMLIRLSGDLTSPFMSLPR
jgi:predicted ATPase